MSEALAWLAPAFANLDRLRQAGQLPHALLISGPAGIGKQLLAEEFARLLLCETPVDDSQACGQCHACHLFASGAHPDILHIQPQEEAKEIKIAQIRELIEKLALARHYARHRVILIQPADRLNTAAANSLLKTLEEPPENTLIILISATPSRLPATIRSRCQTLKLPVPVPEQCLAWLESRLPDTSQTQTLLALAAGAPLKALEMAENSQLEQRQAMLKAWLALPAGQGDPVKLAANWVKTDTELTIYWVYSWICDLIRLQISPGTRLFNPDVKAPLQKLAQALDLSKLYTLLDQVQEGRRLLNTAVNVQSILEGILLYWSNMPVKVQTENEVRQ